MASWHWERSKKTRIGVIGGMCERDVNTISRPLEVWGGYGKKKDEGQDGVYAFWDMSVLGKRERVHSVGTFDSQQNIDSNLMLEPRAEVSTA